MASIASLPEELLLCVWEYLDLLGEPAPSVTGFNDEPRYTFTRRSSTPLKDLTLVCKRWRNLLLPSLFTYSRVALSPIQRWVGLTPRFLQRCERHVTSNPHASERELELVQKMRQLFWSSSTHVKVNDVTSIEYVGNDKLLLQVGYESLHWTPSAHGEVNEYLEFVQRNGLEDAVKSFTLSSDRAFEDPGTAYSCATRECTALWKTVFATISPVRVVVAAHPSVMALLTGSRVGAHDDWLFKQDLHYLEFTRPDSTPHNESDDKTSSSRYTPTPFQTALHNIRPWTHLSYNEGSSIPAYKQYEYFHYAAPSVLRYLLLWIAKEQDRQGGARLQSIRYVACFPFAGHVSEVLDAVAGLKGVGRVETSLAPREGSDALEPARLGRSDPKDCWAEWAQCYRNVLKFLERAGKGTIVDVVEYGNEELVGDLDKVLQQTEMVEKKGNSWQQR